MEGNTMVNVPKHELDALREQVKQLTTENHRLRDENHELKQSVLGNRSSTEPALQRLPAELQEKIQDQALKYEHVIGLPDLKLYTHPDPPPEGIVKLPGTLRPKYFKRFLRTNTCDARFAYEALCCTGTEAATKLRLNEYLTDHKLELDVAVEFRSLSWRIRVGFIRENQRWRAEAATGVAGLFPRCTNVHTLNITLSFLADGIFFNSTTAESLLKDLNIAHHISTLRKLKTIYLRVHGQVHSIMSGIFNQNSHREERVTTAADRLERWAESLPTILRNSLVEYDQVVEVVLETVTVA